MPTRCMCARSALCPAAPGKVSGAQLMDGFVPAAWLWIRNHICRGLEVNKH